MQTTITVYTAKWCGPCRRLKRSLDDAHIRYGEVDVDENPAAGDRIARWTGGIERFPRWRSDPACSSTRPWTS